MILMKVGAAHRFGRRWKATALALVAAILASAFVFVLSCAAPAAAATPWVPTSYNLINCTIDGNKSTAGCQRLDSAPECLAQDAACFKQINAAHTQTTWWISQDGHGVCKGTDTTCLSYYGNVIWTFDHDGSLPDVAQDEQTPVATTQTIPPPSSAKLFTPDGKCNHVVNDFQICSIVYFSNGLEFYALLLCVVGVMMSAMLWAAGSKGENPGQELTGKKGIIVCVVAALIVGAIPGLVTWADRQARATDGGNVNGVTNVTDPGGGPAPVPAPTPPASSTPARPGQGNNPGGAPCNIHTGVC
jgi:hypothetical protein